MCLCGGLSGTETGKVSVDVAQREQLVSRSCRVEEPVDEMQDACVSQGVVCWVARIDQSGQFGRECFGDFVGSHGTSEEHCRARGASVITRNSEKSAGLSW